MECCVSFTECALNMFRCYIIFWDIFLNFRNFSPEFLSLFGERVVLLHFVACMQWATLPPSAPSTALQVQTGMSWPECDFIIQLFTITQHLNEFMLSIKSILSTNRCSRNDQRSVDIMVQCESELEGHTCRTPGSRSAKCFSRAVLLSFASTKEAAARAASIRTWGGRRAEQLEHQAKWGKKMNKIIIQHL